MNYHFYKRHSVFPVLLIILFLTAWGRQLGHIVIPGIAPAVVSACPQAQPSEKIPLRILYVGLPDTDRTKDFVSFLTPYFKEVKTADLNAFKENQTIGFDVAIIDEDGLRFGRPKFSLSDTYSLPTLLVGVPLALWADGPAKLKVGYMWNCLTDAAHGESFTHEVFHQPLKVDLQFELADIPSSYDKGIPEKQKLGDKKDKMNVFYIQKTGQKNYGAALEVNNEPASGDVESIMLGYAPGKVYQAASLARHGNYLLWGHGGAPSLMTPAGRNLFINSIVYIRKFAGQTPTFRDLAIPRKRFLSSLKVWSSNPKIAAQFFPPELFNKYADKFPELAQFYQENIDLLYYAQDAHRIDEQLKSLGFTSNSQLDNLPQLISLLADQAKSAVAQELLVRYTGKTFTTATDWQKWFEQNKDNLKFLEVAGYKFFVLPEPQNKKAIK